MSFENLTDKRMPDDALVKIFFHGLVILRSPSGTTNWYAEILRGVANHTLSIEVRMKEPDKPDMILFRHFGDLPPNLPNLNITAFDNNNQPIPAHASRYIPLFPQPPQEELDKDFSLVFNLGARIYNNTALTVKTAKTRPTLEFTGGYSYLYTAFIKDGSNHKIEVLKNGVVQQELPQLAAIVGANLHLDPNNTVEGKVVISGGPLTVPLELPKPTGNSKIRYEIYVDNSPFDGSLGAGHSEVAEYYKVIEKVNGDDIPPPEQFDLRFNNTAHSLTGSDKFTISDKRATIRIPCMSGTVDG